MNIFEIYLKKIKIIINDLNDKDLLKIPDKLSSITVDTTPANFKSDISTNVAMVLSKPNKKTPIEIGEIIKKKILEDADVADVEIVKQKFYNRICFSKPNWPSSCRSLPWGYLRRCRK